MKDTEINQIFITGTGKYLTELVSQGLGGIIFFSKDIKSETGFKELVTRVKSKSLYTPFLAIDQEGGRVERTENIYPKRLSAKWAYQKGEEFLAAQTSSMANELLDLGLNLNFAPVADVNTNPKNPIIGERAFANNPDDVIKGVKLVSKIYLDKGIIPCVKHFPGHGDASVDSHKALPKIDLSLEVMKKYHLKPFKAASDFGCPMVMVAHLDCACFGETGIPTSLSKNAIDYLRNDIGFTGVIVTDDMNMGGVTSIPPLQAAVKALKAGVNVLLYREASVETYNLISEFRELVKKDEELENAVKTSLSKIRWLKTLMLEGI